MRIWARPVMCDHRDSHAHTKTDGLQPCDAFEAAIVSQMGAKPSLGAAPQHACSDMLSASLVAVDHGSQLHSVPQPDLNAVLAQTRAMTTMSPRIHGAETRHDARLPCSAPLGAGHEFNGACNICGLAATTSLSCYKSVLWAGRRFAGRSANRFANRASNLYCCTAPSAASPPDGLTAQHVRFHQWHSDPPGGVPSPLPGSGRKQYNDGRRTHQHHCIGG